MQVLRFHVYDWDNKKRDASAQDDIGWTEVTLAEIMSSGGAQLARTLNKGDGGILLVAGEEIVTTKVTIFLEPMMYSFMVYEHIFGTRHY